MQDPPFVQREHLTKLRLQHSLLEIKDERLLYPFYRSTSDAVFSDFSEAKLRASVFYLMFDLFPGVKFDGEITPGYLTSYVYDRMRFLLVELRKLDERADWDFVVFCVLLAEYQKSLYAASAFAEIHELYQATNNWLFLKDNVLLNTRALANINISKIYYLEAYNSESELRNLALRYFNSGHILYAVCAAEALGRVRLALSLGYIAVSEPDYHRLQQVLSMRETHLKTGAATMTRWAACEMYLSDPAFAFLRNRQFIVNETWKYCNNANYITRNPKYGLESAWGPSRPVFELNTCYSLPKVKPVITFLDTPSFNYIPEATPAAMVASSPKEDPAEIYFYNSYEQSKTPNTQGKEVNTPLYPISIYSPMKFSNPYEPVLQKMPYLYFYQTYEQEASRATFSFGYNLKAPFMQSAAVSKQAAYPPIFGNQAFSIATYPPLEPQLSVPYYPCECSIIAPTAENKREIRAIIRYLKYEFIADTLIMYMEQILHYRRLEYVVHSMEMLSDSYRRQSSPYSSQVPESSLAVSARTAVNHDYMDIINRFWPALQSQ